LISSIGIGARSDESSLPARCALVHLRVL